jgi:hypothetical protein
LAPTLRPRLDHHWIRPAEYRRREIAASDFEDTLGRERQAKGAATGLPDPHGLAWAGASDKGMEQSIK